MLKKLIKEKLKPIQIKISEEDMKVFREKAKSFTGGNVSAWLREAGREYQPKKKELA